MPALNWYDIRLACLQYIRRESGQSVDFVALYTTTDGFTPADLIEQERVKFRYHVDEENPELEGEGQGCGDACQPI